MTVRSARTPHLDIAFEERNANAAGEPIVLVHGFPDDARTWDAVLARPEFSSRRTLAPYVRGYGPTRFRSATTMRSGETAALARDIVDLLDALEIERCTLVGHDWGGRAAYAAAVLAPQRFARIVVLAVGYNPDAAMQPLAFEQIERYFYQWYFATARGEALLRDDTNAFCTYLWRRWSPGWAFSDADFARTAESFANPDFVPIVLHSYRQRWGFVEADPQHARDAQRLRESPPVPVPTVVLHGNDDGATLAAASDVPASLFPAGYERRLLDGVGHFVQREVPDVVAAAVARA